MKKQIFLTILLSTCFLQLLNAQIASVKQRGGRIVVYDKNGYELSSIDGNALIIGFTSSFYVLKCSQNFGYGMGMYYTVNTFDYKSRRITGKVIEENDKVKLLNNRFISITHNNETKLYDENFEVINNKK